MKYLLATLCVLFLAGTYNVSAVSQQFNLLENTSIINNSVQPRISTQKIGYLSGETVVINGEGFNKFERVSLSVEMRSESLKQNVELMRWDIYTDSQGRFTTNLPFDSLGASDGIFILRALGTDTKASAETSFSNVILAEAAQLTQCANGGVGNPVLPCSGSNWDTGNVNNSKAHWVEGQSVAYRTALTGFTVGSSNTVTISYDTTKGGKHAVDYLTSFDRTETLGMGNDPCSGVGCSLGTFTTFPIPVDPNVTAGFDQIPANGDDITQIPGVFTLFGGTITGVSVYTLSGSYTGDSSTNITVTFTANSANMALAWGGHIGTRADWGAANSAVFISGSPYHMALDACSFGCGAQNRALAASAIIPAGTIIIIKDSQPNSIQPYNFTATGPGVSNFSLTDNGVVGPDRITFSGLSNFGAGNSVSITEGTGLFYALIAINCTSNPNGGSGTNNNTVSVPSRNATIVLEAGEIVTCTFVNAFTTAANVSVSGRTISSSGQPLARTRVTIQNTSNGDTRSVYTNSFGGYRIDDLPAGDFYVVSVWNRKYVFDQPTQSFTLNDAIENVDFTATP